MRSNRISKFTKWIFSRLTDEVMSATIMDDLEYHFVQARKEKGLLAAFICHVFQCLIITFPLLIQNVFGGFVMFRNYIKIILRNMKKHKGYSFINITGLAVGMAVSLLIILYLRFELSYDTYHENADRIYRVTRRFDTPTGYTPHFARVPEAWVNNLPDEFPEIETLVRFQLVWQVDLKIGEEKVRTYRWFTTDPDVFDVFSFPLIHGNPATVLEEPFSVVLTEAMAETYFGKTDVLGKDILLAGNRPSDLIPYKITGVMKNLPPNSHFQIDFLASYQNPQARQGWAWVYILLKSGTDPSFLEEKFPSFIEKYSVADNVQYSYLHLQPLTDIHLRSHLDREIEPNGDIRYIHIFSIVAFLIMLIACFNFMNLSTARSMRRAREIGIRKVLGANRGQLVRYFLNESMVFSFIAFVVAILSVVLLFPIFNAMLDNRMEFDSVCHWSLFIGFLGLCLGTGLFAGSYPSFVLSAFHPLNTLSGSGPTDKSGRRFRSGVRRLLVVLQFTMSIALIVCTLISSRQFSFLSNTKLGMNKDQILAIRNTPLAVRSKYPVLKNELTEHSGILGVSASMDVPSRDILDAGSCRFEGLPDDASAPVLAVQSVDANYIDFMEIELAAGRNFDTSKPFELPGESNQEDRQAFIQSYILAKERTYLINESAVKVFGWKNPQEAIGKRIDWRNLAFRTEYGEIIGVVKDYHYASLRLKIRPLVIMNEPLFLGNILVKIHPHDMGSTLSYMEDVWNRLFPNYPIQYEFLDDLFASLYRTEQRQNHILSLFSILTIFIAYLGLFGLASFTAEQRTKEIGIRKVLGASMSNILYMFSREFTKWVIFAAFFACPLAYWAMNRWLQGYAYRIKITWWPFAIAAGFAFFIAILTVSTQSIKAAIANPVESLRYE